MKAESGIKGNKLTLIGVVWYLLEFAAIILFFREMPPAGSPAADHATYYAANSGLRINMGRFSPCNKRCTLNNS